MNIKTLYIIPNAYYSIGADCHPYEEREYQKKCIDKVLEIFDKGEDSFRWTCSSLSVVSDYLRTCDETSKKKFKDAVKKGKIEVTGFSCNHSSFMSKIAGISSVCAINTEKKADLNVKSLMQSSVGGVNSECVKFACKEGAEYLWLTFDESLAQTRESLPYVFNWRISVKDKVFVWADSDERDFYSLVFADKGMSFNGRTYPNVDDKLAKVIDFSDNDRMILMSSRLCGKLEDIEKRSKYNASVYPVSFTGGDGYNNIKAIEKLIPFVDKWNELGLMPRLEFATVSHALKEVENEVKNNNLPSLTGEWIDFINQASSMPREIAVLRATERKLLTTLSLPVDDIKGENGTFSSLYNDLMIFSENTFRPDNRVENFSPEECFTYKLNRLNLAKTKADMLYNLRVNKFFENEEDGYLYVYNGSKIPFKGLVTFPLNEKERNYYCVVNTDTEKSELLTELEGKGQFYAEIPANTVSKYRLSEEIGTDTSSIRLPVITVDELGFPVEVLWGDTRFNSSALGEFCAVCVDSETKREVTSLLYKEKDIDKKNALVRHYSIVYQSEFGTCERTEDDNFIRFEQPFTNESLINGKRIVTVWKKTPRVTVKVLIDRNPTEEPETYYLKFLLDNVNSTAVTSSGNRVFEVGRGQLSYSDFDSMTIDGWIAYPYDNMMFCTKEAPVISFGGANYFTSKSFTNSDLGCLFSCIFNNTFNDKCNREFSGQMEFTYDIIVGTKCDDFTADKEIYNSCYAEPVVYSKV